MLKGTLSGSKRNDFMKKLTAIAVFMLMAALSLSADIYMKTKTHTDAMSIMGQNTPATDVIAELWIGDNVFVQKSTDSGTIIDLTKNMFYMVNYKDKTYVESPLPLDMAKLLPPEAAAMAGMFTMSATVVPTGDTKKIGSWNCQGYEMTITVMGMPMKTKVWASTDVPFDFAKFAEKFMPALAKGTMRLDDASVKEMMKIKGYQIASEMNAEMMGAKMHVTMDTIEISKKDAPAGIYTVPAGFKKNATMDMPKR
jgi:hypothetical protein